MAIHVILTIIIIWLGASLIITNRQSSRLLNDQAQRYSDVMARMQHEHYAMITVYQGMVRDRDDDIRALTQAIAQSKESVPVIYPRRGPLEPGSGYFDGKPKLVVSPDMPIVVKKV